MHAVEKWVFDSKTDKREITARCNERAIQDGDYHHPLDPPIRFIDRVLESEQEADKYIESHDSGFYDSLAVKFKQGKKINWLVKFEYHC